MSVKTDEIDRRVLGLIGDEPVAIKDLFLRWGGCLGTYRNAVGRLYDQGLLECRWDGNQRFGRYLYWRAAARTANA
jgi:hypothetical protein